MALSNYEIMRNQMREEFVKYDQKKMIDKFALIYDDDYLYIDFVSRPYRIDRKTGVVEWSEDEFLTRTEADYNESMTIYDVLCYSKDDCCLSGKYSPVNLLKGVVQSSGPGGNMFQKYANGFSGKLEGLKKACETLGELVNLKGDLAAKLQVFSFLPIIIQYWDADEEFPANLKFMFDENIMQYMHYETIYFMMGHVIQRLNEMLAAMKEEGNE